MTSPDGLRSQAWPLLASRELEAIAIEVSPGFREFETQRQIEAENVRTGVNIIIAAVAKLPAQPRPAAEWPLDGAERAYDLLRAIHVPWPRDLSFLADQIEEAKQKNLDAARVERAAQDARDAKKSKKASRRETEQK